MSKIELERTLGGNVSAVEALTDDDAAALLTMIAAARQVEKESLDKSIDETLDALPWIFAKPAKKIMFGGRK